MKKKNNPPELEKSYFEKSFYELFHYQYDLRKVFEDFITICICTLAMNPETKKSYYEDDYLKTIEPYKSKGDVEKFAKLYANLIIEMEKRVDSSLGNDVLGEFFEKHVATDRKAQFFTPWPVCMFMAQVQQVEHEIESPFKSQSIMDPACGSGRMLLAARKTLGNGHSFFGIDVDPLCAKITVINLFLNGIFKGEVMCADALNPYDFRESWLLSFVPFRITHITEKEQSPLWNRNMAILNQTIEDRQKEASLITKIHNEQGGTQLKFF